MNRLLSIACCAVILALPAVAAPSASARKSMLGQERLLLNSLVEHNQLISHDTSMSAAADQIRGLIKEAEQAAKNHKWARARNKVDEAQNRYDSSIAL
ncbi:MAG: hypothetical protein KGK30_03665, partial [Elusimicrobia bacterium]|nr:hypothetical protein [Elusimicrobiota bacterium]